MHKQAIDSPARIPGHNTTISVAIQTRSAAWVITQPAHSVIAEAGRREPKAAVVGEACYTVDLVAAASVVAGSVVVALAAFMAGSVADVRNVLDYQGLKREVAFLCCS